MVPKVARTRNKPDHRAPVAGAATGAAYSRMSAAARSAERATETGSKERTNSRADVAPVTVVGARFRVFILAMTVDSAVARAPGPGH